MAQMNINITLPENTYFKYLKEHLDYLFEN